MQGISSRFGNLIDDATAGSSKLRSKIGGLHVDFFHGVRIRDRVRRAGDRDVVILYTINQEIIAPRSLPVHRKHQRAVLVDGVVGSDHYSRRRHSKRQRIQTNQWQIRDGSRRNVLAANLFGGLKGDLGCGSLDVHDLAAATDVQRKIDLQLTRSLHFEATLAKSCKAGSLHLHDIGPKINRVETINTRTVGRGSPADVCRWLRQDHRGVGNHSATWISNRAGYRTSTCDLCS